MKNQFVSVAYTLSPCFEFFSLQFSLISVTHSWFKSFSLVQENLLEDNIVHSWNIAKRIQLDGKLQLLRFADTGAGNIKLTVSEYGSSEPNSDVFERLTLSIQRRLDINREKEVNRQSTERDNQQKETINRKRQSIERDN